jgi:hypothetical protein
MTYTNEPIRPDAQELPQLLKQQRNLVDALSMPELAQIEIEFPRSRELPVSADFEYRPS